MTEMSTRNAVLGILAALATLAAVSLSKAVFAPLVASLMILILIWPLHLWFAARMPQALALICSFLAVVLVLLVGLWLTVWGFSTVSRDLSSHAGAMQQAYLSVVAELLDHGIDLDAIFSGQFGPAWLIRQAQWLAGHLNSALTFLIVTLAYVLLGLIEVEPMRSKLAAAPQGSAYALTLESCRESAAKIRAYMMVRTVMSLATGALVTLLALGFGLNNPVELGIIAFVLNYIPFVGPFIATLVPTLLAIASLPSWMGVIAIFIGLNLVQGVVGSYVEPRIAGNAVSLSPIFVLFAVFFWMFLWGVFGAFIGVPIFIVLLTFCARIPTLQWISHLLDGKPAT